VGGKLYIKLALPNGKALSLFTTASLQRRGGPGMP
jgi:hypothetical protein